MNRSIIMSNNIKKEMAKEPNYNGLPTLAELNAIVDKRSVVVVNTNRSTKGSKEDNAT